MARNTDATFFSSDSTLRRNPQETVVQLLRMSRSTAGRLRRSTLVTLRWTAVLGQTIALLLVWFGLGFRFAASYAVIMIALGVVLNLLVTATLPLDRRVSDTEAAAQLGFDSVQLTALLWLTGGMTNPFAILFLAPVVTSATTLSRPVVWSLGLLAAGLSFGLLFYSQPLPWSPEGQFQLPFLFKLSGWVALMVGMVFTSLYAWRSAKEARRMSEALAATEAVLAREQKLSALGGLAAAAAHELGTPLATIQLVTKEIERDLKGKSDLRDDMQIILSQTQRCRDILQQLALRGDDGDLIHESMSVEAMLEEITEPFVHIGPDIDVSVSGEPPVPTLRRQAELIYSIRNFIDNAVGFARESVEIGVEWTEKTLRIEIRDDGDGFDATVRDHLGEPFVSSQVKKGKAKGLGLGFFIAKTLVERTGGTVDFGNRPEGGARVTLEWPAEAIATG